MELMDHPEGHYRFLTGIAPYSSGVVAMPGYAIVHVTLRELRPYRQGFERIERYLAAQNRPRAALCAIELRSPAPFTFEGFAAFNHQYRQILEDWGLLVAGHNPIARTNVVPAIRPPAVPSLYGFSFTLPAADAPTAAGPAPTFVVAGAGELHSPELTPRSIVRLGETTPEAMQEKAHQVMQTMAARLAGLQVTWSDVTMVDVYTVHPLHTFLPTTLLDPLGPAALHGIRWTYSRPPVIDIEFEMDMRGIYQERTLDPIG